MSPSVQRIQDALDMFRMFESTDRRDEMLERLRVVVEAVKREHESSLGPVNPGYVAFRKAFP